MQDQTFKTGSVVIERSANDRFLATLIGDHVVCVMGNTAGEAYDLALKVKAELDEARAALTVTPRDSAWQPAAEARPALPGSHAARDVLAERWRQIEVEGWTPDHDDRHFRGELAAAAACYIVPSREREVSVQFFWPRNWDSRWWKPAGAHDDLAARRRDLVRGVAMGLAEIERLDRLAARKTPNA